MGALVAHCSVTARARYSVVRSREHAKRPIYNLVPTRFSALAAGNLEAGRVVTGLCIDTERWKSLGGAQLDLNFAPARVM